MATNNNGWNPLKRNPNGVMTDNFNLGNGLNVHDTINVNSNGDITKSHTTFDIGNQQVKIYSDGNTSLKK